MGSPGIQHIYPASLIGQFGTDAGERRRERRVHVAFHETGTTGHRPAEKVGFLQDFPRLYDEPVDGTGGTLDDVWTDAEELIDALHRSVQTSGGKIPRSEFVHVWVPYVAHLFARVPRIGSLIGDDLRTASRGATAWSDRYTLFGRFADMLAAGCQWAIIETNTEPFVTSDSGFVYMPSMTGGALVVPFSPQHAFYIERGPSMLSTKRVTVPRNIWPEYPVRFLNDIITLTAGYEVYASLPAQAERAAALWDKTTAPLALPGGATADDMISLAVPGAMTAFALDRPHGAWLAYAEVAHHVECACRTRKKTFGPCVKEQPAADALDDLVAAIAAETYVGNGYVDPEGFAVGVSPPGIGRIRVPEAAHHSTWRPNGPVLTTSGTPRIKPSIGGLGRLARALRCR